MKKGHSAQPDMLWRTHHTKPDPKIDAGDPSLLIMRYKPAKIFFLAKFVRSLFLER